MSNRFFATIFASIIFSFIYSNISYQEDTATDPGAGIEIFSTFAQFFWTILVLSLFSYILFGIIISVLIDYVAKNILVKTILYIISGGMIALFLFTFITGLFSGFDRAFVGLDKKLVFILFGIGAVANIIYFIMVNILNVIFKRRP